MDGQTENVQIAEDGKTVAVNRGDNGAAVINFSLDEVTVSLATSLPDGDYQDKVYGRTFKVDNGLLTGSAAPETTYIICR